MNQLHHLYSRLVAHPRLIVILFVAAFVLYQQSGRKSWKNESTQPQETWHEAAPSDRGSLGAGSGSTFSKQSTAYAGKGNLAPESAAFDGSGSSSSSPSASLFDFLTPTAHAQQNSMLVRNGHISVYVDSLSTSKQKIGELLKAHAAQIESENQSDEYNNTVLRLTIKVPVEKFQTLFDEILKISEKIRNHSVNVEDVLKQYTDIKSRLENKKELQNRLRILVQKAVKITDILEIERELARVSEEIDSSTKIMKQFENDARLSTISVDFSEPKTQISGPTPLGFIKKLGLALLSGWEMVIDSLLEFVSWWPLWLAMGVGYLWYRRRKSKK